MANKKYRCFYCNKNYETPMEVLHCQEKHEKIIKKTNTETLNSYIQGTLLNTCNISDGKNTFGELYSDKYSLIIALLSLASLKGEEVWYTDKFSDGSSREGFILAGLNYSMDNQITYLIPEEMESYMIKIGERLDMAPPFRGHTSEDVNKRVMQYFVDMV